MTNDNLPPGVQASLNFRDINEARAAEAGIDTSKIDAVLHSHCETLGLIYSGPIANAYVFGQLMGWATVNRARSLFRNGVSAETAVEIVGAEVAMSLAMWQASLAAQAKTPTSASGEAAAPAAAPQAFEPDSDDEEDGVDPRQPDDAAHYGSSSDTSSADTGSAGVDGAGAA